MYQTECVELESECFASAADFPLPQTFSVCIFSDKNWPKSFTHTTFVQIRAKFSRL